MPLTRFPNLQIELEIINDSIEFFQAIEFYPTTYQDLIDRRNQILEEELINNMCESLNIKVAIIKRYYLHNHERLSEMSPMVSVLLGVQISSNLMKYVVNTPKDVIIGDISRGLSIAVELDNLKLNWD